MQILEEMKERGTPFNALTWSLHVEYHVILGDAKAAAAVQQAAREAGFRIRPSSFEMLMQRCERNGERELLVRRPPDQSLCVACIYKFGPYALIVATSGSCFRASVCSIPFLLVLCEENAVAAGSEL